MYFREKKRKKYNHSLQYCSLFQIQNSLEKSKQQPVPGRFVQGSLEAVTVQLSVEFKLKLLSHLILGSLHLQAVGPYAVKVARTSGLTSWLRHTDPLSSSLTCPDLRFFKSLTSPSSLFSHPSSSFTDRSDSLLEDLHEFPPALGLLLGRQGFSDCE